MSLDFVKTTFVMIYKNKGSSNDLTKYRCIGLLTHVFKAFQQYLLEKIVEETQGFYRTDKQGFDKREGVVITFLFSVQFTMT